MRTYSFLFTFLLLFGMLQAQSNSNSSIIVLEQDVVLENLLKSYVALGLGESKGYHKRQMKSALQQFEQNLAILNAETSTHDQAQIELKTLELLWSDFKVLLEDKNPNHERLRILELKKEELEKALGAYAATCPAIENAYLYQELYQQNKRVYHIAFCYMAYAWGYEANLQSSELRSEIIAYEAQLQELLFQTTEQASLNASLMQVIYLWKDLEGSCINFTDQGKNAADFNRMLNAATDLVDAVDLIIEQNVPVLLEASK